MSPRVPFIAVVEDEPAVRKALGRLLVTMNVEVASFASGDEFLDWLPQRRPDCVLLDLHMPGTSGVEVLRRLAPMKVAFPVVVMTAYDEPWSREQCMGMGAAAYLRKPLDDKLLLDTIAGTILASG